MVLEPPIRDGAWLCESGALGRCEGGATDDAREAHQQRHVLVLERQHARRDDERGQDGADIYI